MKFGRLSKLIVAGVLAAGIGTAVLADDNDDNSWWPNWGMGRMMGWGMYGSDAMLDRVDGRLAYLKTEIKITDAQAPAWDELAKAVRTTAETHNAMMRDTMKSMRSGEFWKKPLPERLALQETHLTARLDQVKVIRAAVDKLYGILTPEQKAVADEIVLPATGMGPGRGTGRHMMMDY